MTHNETPCTYNLWMELMTPLTAVPVL